MFQTFDGVLAWGERVYARVVAHASRCLEHSDVAVSAASIADHLVGYLPPNSGVVAYLDIDEIQGRIDLMMDAIFDQEWFRIGTTPSCPDNSIFDDQRSTVFGEICPGTRRGSTALARESLGPVGSGKHFVDQFSDDSDTIWVGVHLGSRRRSRRTASGFMNLADEPCFGETYRLGGMDHTLSVLGVPCAVG